MGIGVLLRREGRGGGRGQRGGLYRGRKFLESLSTQFFPKGGKAEGGGRGHLPDCTALAVSGPPRLVLPACLLFRGSTAALCLPPSLPPPQRGIRLRCPQPAVLLTPACGRVFHRDSVPSASPLLGGPLQPPSSFHSSPGQVRKFGGEGRSPGAQLLGLARLDPHPPLPSSDLDL